jgi:uncharacterized protein (TIGR02594 family)
MKRFIIICICCLVAGCNGKQDDTSLISTAIPYLGYAERTHRNELQELTGVDPVRTEWCAAFVNSVLEIDGIPNLNDQTRYPPLMARSFLHWGERVELENIQRGDVVIFPRGNSGWKGHVGFYVDTQVHNGREYWIILGGNQSNEVRYDFYSPDRALGIRRQSNENSNVRAKSLNITSP